MKMKRISVEKYIWAVMLSTTSLLRGQNPIPSVTISTSKAAYKLGETVYLRIDLHNSTKSPIPAWISPNLDQAELYGNIEVNHSGKRLEPTEYERKVRAGQIAPLSRKLDTIEPGKSMSDGLDLNRLFILNKTGRYTVFMSYTDTANKTKGGDSNVIAFDIK